MSEGKYEWAERNMVRIAAAVFRASFTMNGKHFFDAFEPSSTCFVLDIAYYYYNFIVLSGVRLSPLGTAVTNGLLYQPQMIDDGDCGAIGGMKIGRGNRSTGRKHAPVPLCPPQIPHDLTQARTRAAAVGSQRLTAWAMARPIDKCNM
jgi:hypothetical protein